MKFKNRLSAVSKVKPKNADMSACLTLEQDHWMQASVSGFLSKGQVHAVGVEGPWDLDAIERDLGEFLERTSLTFRTLMGSELEKKSKMLVLALSEDCYVSVRKSWLQVYGRFQKEAENVAEGLKAVYKAKPEAKEPCFFLIKQNPCGIDSEEIPLSEVEQQSEDQLTLHYGCGFVDWHRSFLEKFRSRQTGISFFEGPPGTGKTSYIRELMRLLKDSHQFYFLPSANLDALKNPEFIDFWSGERRQALDKNLVVILEDAESALVPRHDDNRKQVSVLLNITDGILGEFLKLQIIATVNCGIHEIDQALLRPGRLVARKHFGKLKEADARKLAAAHGKALADGESFSLADIFGSEEEIVEGAEQPRRVGFEV